MGRKGTAEQWLTEDGLDWIHGWAREGLVMADIAANMGISEATLYRWIKKHPDIEDAIRRGKGPADYRVASAMYQAALGQKVTLKKPIKVRETIKAKGKGEKVVEKVVYAEEEVYIPPDPRAQIHWLQNRDPDHWGRGQRAEVAISAAEGEQVMAEIEARLDADALGGEKP